MSSFLESNERKPLALTLPGTNIIIIIIKLDRRNLNDSWHKALVVTLKTFKTMHTKKNFENC